MNDAKIGEAIHEITNFPETTKTKEEKEGLRVKIQTPVFATNHHAKHKGIYANPVIRIYQYWDKVLKVLGP